MRFLRLPIKDPRTVARDIPGVCDLLFPQLLPAIIAHMNREAKSIPGCTPVPQSLISGMSTNAAMLFEVAYARAEQIMSGNISADWDSCLNIALKRQAKYFDAVLPEKLSEIEVEIANLTANNLVTFLSHARLKQPSMEIKASPIIPGYHWISEGKGDFSIGTTLIEVKCSGRNFSSSDYRQVLMYWLLSYVSAIEDKSTEWKSGVLLNPRLNKYIEFDFTDLVKITGEGRSKIEIIELFSSIIGDYELRMENIGVLNISAQEN